MLRYYGFQVFRCSLHNASLMTGPLNFLLWLSIVLVTAGSAVGQSSAVEEIVTLAQLRKFASMPESGERPIRVRGVVVCFDSGWHQLYIHDGHNTEYFNA